MDKEKREHYKSIVNKCCKEYTNEIVEYKPNVKVMYSSQGIVQIFELMQQMIGWSARLDEMESKVSEIVLCGKEMQEVAVLDLDVEKTNNLGGRHRGFVNEGYSADERKSAVRLDFIDEEVKIRVVSLLVSKMERLRWVIINRRKLISEVLSQVRVMKDLLEIGIRLNEISVKGD